MEVSTYQNSDSWVGGYYELSIELHPTGDTKRLLNTLNVLCKLDQINELYERQEDYKHKVTIIPHSIERGSSYRLYTTVNLPNNTVIGAVIIISRIEGESDWISLSIPIGMLEKVYHIDYGTEFSISYTSNNWQKSLDQFFTRIAEMIYVVEPFDFAIIGWEVSAETNRSEVTADIVETTKVCLLLPDETNREIQSKRDSVTLANGLHLYLPIDEDETNE